MTKGNTLLSIFKLINIPLTLYNILKSKASFNLI